MVKAYMALRSNIDINIDKLYVYELLVNFDGTFSETSKTYDLSTLLEANSK